MSLRRSKKLKPTEVPEGERTRREEAARAALAERKARGKRTRTQRILRFAAWTFVVLLVARVALGFAMPWVIDSYAKRAGLRSSHESMWFSLLLGRVELAGFELRARSDDAERDRAQAALARVDSVSLDVSVSRLLFGRVVVPYATVDGVRATLERDGQGAVRLGPALLFDPAARVDGRIVDGRIVDDAEAVADDSSDDARGFDFGLGVECAVLRCADVRIEWRDASVKPRLETQLRADLRGRDLGVPGREGEVDLGVAIDGVLAEARIEARLRRAEGAKLDVAIACAVDGLRPERVRGLLDQIGLEARAAEYDAALAVELALEGVPREGAEADAPVETLRGSCVVPELWLRSDTERPVRLGRIEVPIEGLTAKSLELSRCTVEGFVAEVERFSDGRLAIAGVATKARDTETSAEETPEAGEGGVAEAFVLVVDEVDCSGAQLRLRDAAVEPAADLRLAVRELRVRDVGRSGKATTVDARLEVAGVARELRCSARAELATAKASAKLEIDGLRPDALRAHLRELGLEHELSAKASFAANLELAWDPKLELDLREVALVDGEDRLRLDQLSVRGLDVDAPGLIRVASVDVRGKPIALRRDADGVLHACGFALRGAAKSTSGESTSGESTSSGASSAASSDRADAPSLHVARATIEGLGLRIRDEAIPGTRDFAIEDFKLAASDLGFGPAAPASNGECRVTCRIAGLAERVALTARSSSKAGGFELGATLEVDGVDGPALDPYLRPLGFEVDASAAALRAKSRARWLPGEQGAWQASGAIEELSWRDGESGEAKKLASIDAIRFDGVAQSEGYFALGKWSVDAPRISCVLRDGDVFEVAGIRLGAAAAGEKPAPSELKALPEAGEASPWTFAGVTLQRAVVAWRDERAKRVLETELRCEGSVDAVDARGAQSDPTPFQLEMHLGKSIDSLLVQGDFSLGARRSVRAKLEGDGLRAAPDLAAYLPKHIQAKARAGRLRATLEAEQSADGSFARFAMRDIDYREAGAAKPWLAIPSADFVLETDAQQKRYVVRKATLDRVEYEVAIDADGALRTLGFRIEAPPAARARDAADGAAVPSATDAQPVPNLRIEELRLGIARLSYESAELGGVPLELACELVPLEPFTLIRPDAAKLPPMRFVLRGSCSPFVRTFEGRMDCSPFVAEPELNFDLDCRGLRGDAFASFAPRAGIDGGALEGASLRMKSQVKAKIRRRRATDFPVADGFGLEAVISELALRAQGGERVLAAVERVEADVQRILPRSGAVHVKELRVTKPKLDVSVEADALGIAGIRMLDAAASREAGASPRTPDRASPERAAPTATPGSGGGEFRLDLFAVEGIDFALEDKTVEPSLRAPLTGLDVEVKEFTTRAMRETLPISFHVFAEGGKVALPERVDKGIVGGFLGAVAGAIGGGDDEFKVQQRPFFGEFALQGRVALHPALEGFVKTSIDSLELPALRGLAKKAGFEIGDGVLDSGLALRFLGAQGFEVDSRSTFTYLSLDEPADGPISTYLKLPAPLDTVLFVLRNENGEHVVPFAFSVPGDGMSGASVAGAAVSSFVQIVGNAIAASPFRIVGGVVSLVDSGEEEAGEGLPVKHVDFDVVSTELTKSDAGGLGETLRALLEDESYVVRLQHLFVKEDFLRAESLANPKPREARALASRLRKRKLAMLARRRSLRSELHSYDVLDREDRALATRARLREVDRELSRTEASIDRVCGLLRRGAERRRVGRTKRFATEIAKLRIDAVRRALIRRGVPDARIEVRRPKLDLVPSGDMARVLLQLKRRPK